MDWQELVREIGALTQDDQLVRGVLTIGAAVVAIALTAWKTIYGRKQDVPRVKIDAPNDVKIIVDPVSDKPRQYGKEFISKLYDKRGS